MVLGPVIKSMLASSNDMESLMTHVQTLKMAIEDSCLLPDTPVSGTVPPSPSLPL